MNLHDLSAGLLVLFAIVGAIDGIYLHLWRFQLHLRPEARCEHLVYTLRSLLFPPVLVLVLAGNTGGLLLWAGLLCVLADVAVTVWDLRAERWSRSFQGGLPRHELALYVAATVFHLGALALSLLGRPSGAFELGAPWLLDAPEATRAWAMAWRGLLPGAVAVAVLHVVAMRLGALRAGSPVSCRLCTPPA